MSIFNYLMDQGFSSSASSSSLLILKSKFLCSKIILGCVNDFGITFIYGQISSSRQIHTWLEGEQRFLPHLFNGTVTMWSISQSALCLCVHKAGFCMGFFLMTFFHSITEWFQLKENLKIIQFQPACHGHFRVQLKFIYINYIMYVSVYMSSTDLSRLCLLGAADVQTFAVDTSTKNNKAVLEELISGLWFTIYFSSILC